MGRPRSRNGVGLLGGPPSRWESKHLERVARAGGSAKLQAAGLLRIRAHDGLLQAERDERRCRGTTEAALAAVGVAAARTTFKEAKASHDRIRNGS